jgi:hypothetical protein
MNHVVHDIRGRNLNQSDNPHLKIGRRQADDFVTAFSIQNIGKNSVLKIIKDGNELLLRPFEPPFTIGVEYPSIIDCKLVIKFEAENQIQFEANGSRSAIDTAETVITEPDAVHHSATLFETFVKEIC